MDPMTLSLMLGLLQGGAGLMMNGGKYPSLDYQIPSSQLKALNNAKYMASLTEIPGASTVRENIGNNTANTISALTEVADSPASLMGNISRAGVGANRALRELGTDNANYFANNQASLRGELGRMAGYEDKEQLLEYEDRQRQYEMNQRRKQALIGGGLQNVFGSLNTMSSANFYKDMIEGMKDEEKTGTTLAPISNFFSRPETPQLSPISSMQSPSWATQGGFSAGDTYGKQPYSMNNKGMDIWQYLLK